MTKPGARFGFSVWGRRDNFSFDKVTDDLMRKYGITAQDAPPNPNYKFCQPDESCLIKVLVAAGFRNVKVWYQQLNFNFRTWQEYLAMFPRLQMNLEKFEESKRADFMKEFVADFERTMGPSVRDPKIFETLVAIAEK